VPPLRAVIRAVIADDQPFFRQGLARLLRGSAIEVVAEASDGRAALDAAEELTPDVVVLDIKMPGLVGADVIRELAERAPVSRVLVLTASTEESDVMDAILAGARGYVLKDRPVEEIVAGVKAVAAGECLVCPRTASMLVKRVRAREQANSRVHPAELTARELAVLALVVAGWTNDEIGNGLRIGPGTARNHVSSLLMKLDAENRVQAAVRAVREGIV
jgi:DNA-binding NarL/FixJ family response regulator